MQPSSGLVALHRIDVDEVGLENGIEDIPISRSVIFDSASLEAVLETDLDWTIPAISADGTRAIVVPPGGPIEIVDPRRGEVLASLSGIFSHFSLSGDGSLLSVVTEPIPSPGGAPTLATVEVFSTDTGARLALVPLDGAVATNSKISPNMAQLVFTTNTGELMVYDLDMLAAGAAKDSLLFAVTAHNLSSPRVDYSPDGSVLATSDAGGRIRLWDAATGAVLGEVPGLAVPALVRLSPHRAVAARPGARRRRAAVHVRHRRVDRYSRRACDKEPDVRRMHGAGHLAVLLIASTLGRSTTGRRSWRS